MTMPIDTAVTLLATGVGFAFLIACAWHNRRIGYKKVRPVESPVDEAILWFAALKDSLASEGDGLRAADAQTPAAGMKTETEAEQLVRLNSALHGLAKEAQDVPMLAGRSKSG